MIHWVFNKESGTWTRGKLKYDNDIVNWFVEYFLFLVADRPIKKHNPEVLNTKNTIGVDFIQLPTHSDRKNLLKDWGIPADFEGIVNVTNRGLSRSNIEAEAILNLMVLPMSWNSNTRNNFKLELKMHVDLFVKNSAVCVSHEHTQEFYQLTVEEFINALVKLAFSMNDKDDIDTKFFTSVAALF